MEILRVSKGYGLCAFLYPLKVFSEVMATIRWWFWLLCVCRITQQRFRPKKGQNICIRKPDWMYEQSAHSLKFWCNIVLRQSETEINEQIFGCSTAKIGTCQLIIYYLLRVIWWSGAVLTHKPGVVFLIPSLASTHLEQHSWIRALVSCAAAGGAAHQMLQLVHCGNSDTAQNAYELVVETVTADMTLHSCLLSLYLHMYLQPHY